MKPEAYTKSDRVIFHIGLHKTASTWFQKDVFANRSDWFGMHEKFRRSKIHSLFCQESIFNDIGDNQLYKEFVAEIDDILLKSRYCVVSHERLSGYPPSGSYDLVSIAKKIKKYFPNAKVMLLIREQRAMIYSMWKQQIKDGGSLSLNQYLRPIEVTPVRIPRFTIQNYDYDRIASFYKKLFGDSNVLVLPFELLKYDLKILGKNLAEFLELDSLQFENYLLSVGRVRNESVSVLVLSLHRIANILFSKNQLSRNGLLSVNTRYLRACTRFLSKFVFRSPLSHVEHYFRKRNENIIAEITGKYYCECNRKLEAKIKYDLKTFGYM